METSCFEMMWVSFSCSCTVYNFNVMSEHMFSYEESETKDILSSILILLSRSRPVNRADKQPKR